MTARPIGVGIIGLGVGEQHADAFGSHPDSSVVALCDTDSARLAGVAKRFPNARMYSRAEELIDDPHVGIVSVASYDDQHHAQVVRALRAGKHVFAEKPLCTTGPQLREIQTVWRRSGRRLSTNTILRRSPRFQWLRDAVANGTFGTVYCFEADYVYGRHHKLTDGWRGRIPGYSVMLGGGIHLVDLLLWATGQRPTEVVAYGSGLASVGTSFSGNDLVLALLQFDSGLTAKIGANFASVHPHFHRVVVYGTAATFENPLESCSLDGRLWTSRDPDQLPTPVPAAYPGIGKGDSIPAFIDAVLKRGDPDVNEEELFAAVSVCLAIDQSVAERRPVTVAYD